MRTTPRGLQVWDLPTDEFDHTQLSGNWDLIDSLFGTPPQQFETRIDLPTSGLFAGRIVMLSAAPGGSSFQPWTLVRYDGTSWRAINQLEVQPIIPTLNLYAGRIVILSQSSGGFPAWSVIRYDGSAWGIVGGWQSVNTGAGSSNINGLATSGDVQVNTGARGLVLRDRVTNQYYRIYFQNGNLMYEAVS